MAILRCLIENHGLRKVYMEGLAERDQIIFDAQVSAARSVADELEGFRKERGEILTAGDLSKEDQAYVDRVAALEQQHRFNLLRVVR